MTDINEQLFNNKIIYFDNGVLKWNRGKIFTIPTLYNNMCEYINAFTERKLPTFDSIIPITNGAIPYASDIAISLGKMMYLIDNRLLNGLPEYDENILLFVDILDDKSYELLEHIYRRLIKLGANVMGIVLLFNQELGEYVKINKIQENIFYGIFQFASDICEYGYDKKLISQFEYEKYKFYSDSSIKMELNKLFDGEPPAEGNTNIIN